MNNNPLPKEYWIADISLADKGKRMLDQTLYDMPGMTETIKKYGKNKPLKGLRIVGCVLVTYETANFILTLKELGADLRWCSDNRFASLDDACAYVVTQGVPVFAKKGETEEEFFWAMERAIEFKDENGNAVGPDFIVDDGCDISMFLHKNMPELYETIRGTTEQTTCGVNFFYDLKREGLLKVPVINVNESVTKSKFDNIYGSRESLLEGIQKSLNIQMGGKRVVVFGYGEVGKGSVQALKGVGSHVVVVEVDPIVAMQAHMDGVEIMKKDKASQWGDLFISATGCDKTIDKSEIELMKDGAVLMNMGHGNMEVNTQYLNSDENTHFAVHAHAKKYTNKKSGKSVVLLADGFLVNLVGGEGHPPRVMSITFTNHILGLFEFLKNGEKYAKGEIYRLPRNWDEEAAKLNFPEIMHNLEELTDEQAAYMAVPKCGPFKREDYRY